MAIRLRQAGITDFACSKNPISSAAPRDNTYPGAACDVPSPLYSFSFEDFDWPRFYSGQQDIHRYQQHCVTKYRLIPHVRLNTEVRRTAFDERRGTSGRSKPPAKLSIAGQASHLSEPQQCSAAS
jgi:cation diffusion facilitator CzcD-associated flavoprotein CzcO